VIRVAVLLAALGGCGEDRAPRRAAPEPTVEAAPAPAATAGVGTIRGTVRFVGKAPVPEPIVRGSGGSQGTFCARATIRDESLLLGTSGALANVAVYLTRAPATTPVPSTAIVVDQEGCTYRPRLQVARLGQRLEVRNGDPTLHNVHAWRDRETVFNQAQIEAAAPITRPLDEPGLVTLKCDVHAWMRAWILVLPHAFAAVTGETGEFSLPEVPAGTYVLEAWHERVGTKRRPVTVPPGGVAEVALELALGE